LAPDPELTPAQTAFIIKHLPDFSPESCTVELAGQAGSVRYFVRITSRTGRSVILVVWDSKDEDWPRFLSIPVELAGSISFLPRIIGSDPRHGLIIEEDFGETTLHRYCSSHNGTDSESMFRRVLDAACKWQNLDPGKSPTIASRNMDIETFLWETDYFARRCVVDFCGCEAALDAAWEKERRALAKRAAELPQTPIHRDFQSENVMIVKSEIRFVDFQGARMGPPAYDVASLLFDPYCGFLTAEMSSRLFGYYSELPLKIPAREDVFYLCAAQRLMQALGAYGNLSIHKGKTRYKEFVPVALKRLHKVMTKLPEYKGIGRVVEECLTKV